MDDPHLLRQLAAEPRSPDALAHLVGRHVHLVHSACLRQLRDPVLADQATQAAFILLARHAPRLSTPNLTPWLFDAAQNVCRAAGAARPHANESPSPGYRTPGDWTT